MKHIVLQIGDAKALVPKDQGDRIILEIKRLTEENPYDLIHIAIRPETKTIVLKSLRHNEVLPYKSVSSCEEVSIRPADVDDVEDLEQYQLVS